MSEIPSLAPLAPIVDRMRELAVEHLPEGRTCRVVFYDDGTFKARITHSGRDDYYEAIIYQRQTAEILHAEIEGAGYEEIDLGPDETLHEPTFERYDVEVLARVEPPYQ